ncbi:MAG: hypothetical protein PVI04_08445 [Anaerolineales bacterium]|jgi:hypothetical protein
MSSVTYFRIAGGIAILAGILNVLSGLADVFPERTLTLIRRVADISTLIAIVGIYLYQRDRLGILGQIGFPVVLVGVLMLIFSFRYETALGIYSFGLVVFGIATLRASALPGWAAWLWIAAPFISIPAFLFEDLAQLFFQLASIAFALGFIGTGYYMMAG